MHKQNLHASFFDQKVAQLNRIRDAVNAFVASKGKQQRFLAVVAALAVIVAINIIAWTLLEMNFKAYGWALVPIVGALAAYAYHKVSTYNPNVKLNADAIYALIDVYEPLNKTEFCHLLGQLSPDREFNVAAVQLWMAAELRTINRVQYPTPPDKTLPPNVVNLFSR